MESRQQQQQQPTNIKTIPEMPKVVSNIASTRGSTLSSRDDAAAAPTSLRRYLIQVVVGHVAIVGYGLDGWIKVDQQ